MPSNSAHTSLTLPPSTNADPVFVRALNERLRIIAAQLDAAGSTANGHGAASGAASLILFSFPGVIGIKSNFAPLVSLSTSQTPSEILILAKRAPMGGKIQAQVNVGGSSYAILGCPDRKTSASLSSGLAAIPANSLITVDIVSVPASFPGADISILVRF